MRLLLDTVGLICVAFEPTRLSARVVDLIADDANQVMVSAASAWEIATKVRLGKLDQAKRLASHWQEECARLRFDELPITAVHALRSASFDIDHRDPFDRLICAQGELEQLTIVTNDAALDLFPVTTIW